jgi:hypothetical protein
MEPPKFSCTNFVQFAVSSAGTAIGMLRAVSAAKIQHVIEVQSGFSWLLQEQTYASFSKRMRQELCDACQRQAAHPSGDAADTSNAIV